MQPRGGDGHVRTSFAGLDADVGAHDGVGVAIVGDDVGPSQQRDVAAGTLGTSDLAFGAGVAALEPAALVERDEILLRWNLAGSSTRPSMRSRRPEARRPTRSGRLQVDALHRADQAERDVDDVVAGRNHVLGRAARSRISLNVRYRRACR